MKPQLVLMRILRRPTTPRPRTPSPNSRDPAQHHTGTAQWDVNHPFHLAALESQGILQTYTLETAEGGAKASLYPCVAFQLHLWFGGAAQESGNKCGDTSRKDWNEEFCNGLKPIKQPWGSFEFIPKRRGEIIFFQAESSRILFAQLPGGSPRSLIYSHEERAATQIDQDRSKVYCVGRHSSTILSISVRPDGLALVSAARDGCLRIWRLSDGTMIAQTMFARWRQPRTPGIGRVSPLRRQNDEIDCAYPALRVVCFFGGKSWDVAMGCPSGEARTWTQEVDEGSPLTMKRMDESATLLSGKSPISSLALHIPDPNFPLLQQQQNYEDDAAAGLGLNFHERVAVGTSCGKLQVWTRHRNLKGDWAPTWSTTPSSEGASIVCLSFRADGGLIAAAASFLAKQLTEEETEALLLVSPPRKIKRVCERVYLYETSSWSCVGSMNFSSQIGTCLFYRPAFRAQDKQDPRSCMSREKLSSCRLLLVATASGPQAHILPKHGLFFGSTDGRHRHQQPAGGSFRKEAKTVRWADLKRERGPEEGSQRSPSPSTPRDHPVRSAPATSMAASTSSTHAAAAAHRSQRDREQLLRPVTEEDLLWTPNSPMGRRGEARRNPSPAAAAKSRGRSSPPRSRSRSPAGCVHSVRRPPPVRDPYQDPSLLSLPAECVGLPMEAVMKYRAGTRHWPSPRPRTSTRKCLCCSKHARSKELPVPYPMGQVAIQKLNTVGAANSKQILAAAAAARPPSPPRRRTRRATSPQAPRHPRAPCAAALTQPSATRSRSATPLFRSLRKPRTILSTRFHVEDDEDDEQTPRNEHECESVSECESQFHDEEYCPASLQQQQPRQRSHSAAAPAPDEPTGAEQDDEPESPAAGGDGREEEEEEEETREETPPNAAIHPQATTSAQQAVIGGNRFYTAAMNQQPLQGGKENIHDPDERPTDPSKHHPSGGAPQCSRSGNDLQSQKQQLWTNRKRAQYVGGDNLPDKQIVGGNELEDFLVEERCPLKVVGRSVWEMAQERKLMQPEPFSTAKLMARLREIEQETFSVEAALRVAKLRGIELDDEDEKELRRILEGRTKKEAVRRNNCAEGGHESEPSKQPVRYTQLRKINDPRASHPGPFLAARKVRKQVDPQWEDMRTMKPALSDLWDSKERCAQVCSRAPAGRDHNVIMDLGVERDAEHCQLQAQMEATCRHAWSSQTLYDGFLYRPDQPDPHCGCDIRVQISR